MNLTRAEPFVNLGACIGEVGLSAEDEGEVIQFEGRISRNVVGALFEPIRSRSGF